jgi:hypothetical protein
MVLAPQRGREGACHVGNRDDADLGAGQKLPQQAGACCGGLMTWQGLMASVVHRALDGAAATFQSSLPLDGPFTSVVNVRMHERLQEFTAGARSLGRAVAADHGIAHFDETYSFQGGRLSLGEVDIYDPGLKLAATFRLAVWEGERFSIHTHVYDQESNDLIRILRRFTFVEGETGVAIQPKDKGRTPFDDSASILREIPGLGLLEVTGRTAATSVGLPAWRGTRTAGGELFRDTVDNRQDYFVLVSPEMKATIIPDPNSDPTTILPHLDELKVRWRP